MTIATALLMAGCSQNEITEVSPDANPAIGFSVYSGVQTKGTAITAATDLKSGFGVFAYHTGATDWSAAAATATPNFMFNQKVTSANGTAWAYTPVKYWPMADEKVTFFAYAPYNEASVIGAGATIAPSANTATNAPALTFSINPIASGNDAKKMVDFMVAKNDATATQNRTYSNSAGGVTFTFQHTLSRLTFEGKPDVELATGTDTKGTTFVMVKSAKIVQASSSKFYKSGVFNCGAATWGTKTAATADYDFSAVLAVASQTGSVTGYSTQAVALTSNGTPKALFTANQYLFLIPETANGGSGTGTAGDITIQFAYDIVTLDANVSGGHTVTSHTTDAKLPTGALKQGVAYKYTVEFGIHEVKFLTPTIEAWPTPGTTGDITA